MSFSFRRAKPREDEIVDRVFDSLLEAFPRCRSLDLKDLRRNGFFDGEPNQFCVARLQWGADENAIPEAYYFRLDHQQGPMAIAFLGPRNPESPDEGNIHGALLTTTRPHFGGRRWWFQCPLVVNGVPCRRRCRILYKPYGSRYFGCRHCHRLTYRSRQIHRNVIYEGFDRALAAAAVLDRARDPRCSYRRKARAIRRAEKAEPVVAAMWKRLGGP